MALITLAAAKAHLRIPPDDNDSNADVYLKMQQATDLILGRCNSTAWWRAITPAWTIETVPASVQSAILVILTHLHEHRGDDMAADKAAWDAVERLIPMNKDPVLA